MKYQEIEGDLIQLSFEGKFDLIVHGCNVFCTQKAGIAKSMVKAFHTDKFKMEDSQYKGDINKLGNIDYQHQYLWFDHPNAKEGYAVPMGHKSQNQKNVKDIYVVNAYTQFMYGTYHSGGVEKPLDYEALRLCLRKINHIFKGKHIGLPAIGCGLAGGIWDFNTANLNLVDYDEFLMGFKKDVKTIIQEELADMDVTIVHYKK